jgi:hypothetical protein
MGPSWAHHGPNIYSKWIHNRPKHGPHIGPGIGPSWARAWAANGPIVGPSWAQHIHTIWYYAASTRACGLAPARVVADDVVFPFFLLRRMPPHLKRGGIRRLGPYWTQVGLISGPAWTHIGPILDPYWTHIGSILDPYWPHIGPILDTYWTHIGFISGPA